GPDTIIARPGQPAPFSPRAACVTIRGHARARARAASCRPVSIARVSRPPARALIVPALTAAGFVPLAAWLRFGIDDAFINFRYAENLAAGLGPVFNAGERVEGYTTPAWVFLLAGLHRLGAPLLGTAHVLGIAAAATTVLAAGALATRAAPRLGAIAGAFAAILRA